MASVRGILNIQSLNELTSENTTLGGTVGSHLAGHSVTALQQRLTHWFSDRHWSGARAPPRGGRCPTSVPVRTSSRYADGVPL